MAERFKAPVLKTGDEQSSVGSNPTLSANFSLLARESVAELCDVLERIRTDLRDRGSLEASDMYDSFGFILEDAVGFGCKLGDFGLPDAESLSAELKDFLRALVYAESVCDLLSALAYDGLASVFYNWTSPSIDRLRNALREEQDPASSLVDRAYQLAAPKLQLGEEGNWVTRNRDESPFDALGPECTAAIEEIEGEIEAQRHATFERAAAAINRRIGRE